MSPGPPKVNCSLQGQYRIAADFKLSRLVMGVDAGNQDARIAREVKSPALAINTGE